MSIDCQSLKLWAYLFSFQTNIHKFSYVILLLFASVTFSTYSCVWHLLWGLTNWGISSLSSEYSNVRVSEETLNCLFPSRLLLYCALECILKNNSHVSFYKKETNGVNFSTAPFTKVSLGERMLKLRTDVIPTSLHCLLENVYFWWFRRKTRQALLNCFSYSNKSCNMIWGCASLSFTPQTTFSFLERPSRATLI